MGWALPLVPLALLMALIVIDLAYTHRGWKLARAMDLPREQTVRFIPALAFGPVMVLLAVVFLVAAGVLGPWQDWLVGAMGAVPGVWIGRRRYLKQYLRADPAHRAIVVRRSLLEYRILSLLIVLGRLTMTGWLGLLMSLVLSVVVFESLARSWLLFQRYRAEVAS